jgi:molybdenum cofactor guanylyltransferase
MRLLGAIIAGGRSTRFGSDKAEALFAGRPLIAHVAEGLRAQTSHLVVCGRRWPGLETVPDRPQPNLGPLGGLCGALRHAAAHGFDAVLTAGCDVLPIPESLAARLGDGPACIAGQRLIGMWPVALADLLETHLRSSSDHSIRSWVSLCQASEITINEQLHNLNTAADLESFARSLKYPAAD